MSPKALDPKMSVDGQIATADIPALRSERFRSVINCRPDGEEPGQPSSDEIAAAAAAAGLGYAHVPVTPGNIGEADIAAFEQALETLPQPVFGYCKTGARAAMLWSLSQCNSKGADAVIEAAGQAGYDLSSLRPRMDKRGG